MHISLIKNEQAGSRVFRADILLLQWACPDFLLEDDGQHITFFSFRWVFWKFFSIFVIQRIRCWLLREVIIINHHFLTK